MEYSGSGSKFSGITLLYYRFTLQKGTIAVCQRHNRSAKPSPKKARSIDSGQGRKKFDERIERRETGIRLPSNRFEDFQTN